MVVGYGGRSEIANYWCWLHFHLRERSAVGEQCVLCKRGPMRCLPKLREIAIDSGGLLSSLGNRPHGQTRDCRGACRRQQRFPALKSCGCCRSRCSRGIKFDASILDHSFANWTAESHSNQDQVCIDCEVGGGEGFELGRRADLRCRNCRTCPSESPTNDVVATLHSRVPPSS